MAATAALALGYPEPLRRRLLPILAEAMAEGGQVRAAERLIGQSGETQGLDYARALVDQRAGRIDQALARLDRLAMSPDRSERARAAVRAVEMRLAAGRLEPGGAADALERLVAAWRGDEREVALRLRVASLRARAGQFRPALAMLRESVSLTGAPWTAARREEAREQMASVFAETLARDDAAPLAPLEFVSLIEDNADLLPTGPRGEAVAKRVAERLAALDLPERAAVTLRRLVDAAPPGIARASLGALLAAAQLESGDADAALTTLSASTTEDAPPSLVAERTLIFARASARVGRVEAATAVLAGIASPEARGLQTELLEKAGRWSEAAVALARVVASEVPESGALAPESGPLLLRLARAAAQAGEATLLDQIRTDYLPRLPSGGAADMLRMLTEGPVRGVADLPRAAQEAALARSVIH